MFICQLTSASGFGEHLFFKELLTAVSATKEGSNVSCMTGRVGKPSTNIEFVKFHQATFRISPLGVHVSLQLNEFHLAIHCQVKWMDKHPYFNLTSLSSGSLLVNLSRSS